MELTNARISMLVNKDYTDIEIEDNDSLTVIVKIQLTPEQLSQMLSRQAYVKCEKCQTGNLSKVGKKHENKTFEFEVAFSKAQKELELACNMALLEQKMYEWVPDTYYQSQNSFFMKDGKEWARTTIRRWV